MFYIKLGDDMSLTITVSEPIYRGDNLNQTLTYLVPLTIGDIDMLTATIYLNYIRADGTADVVMLERQEEKYNESYFQYRLPLTNKITKYAGEVCTWVQVCSGPVSNPIIAKSSECVLHILESKNMDEYLSDRLVTTMYQLQKQIDDGFADVDSAIETIVEEKADNIIFDSEDSTIQLIANGEPIGDKIVVSANIDAKVVDMKISEDGELIAFFDDETIKVIGKITDGAGVVYVPHVDAHKILTFTIEEKAGEIPEPVDLNPTDEWSGIDGEEVKTDYVWDYL